ncbi:MAG: nuclear transport factor 2 family protein [Ramlibacter sp.]
MTRQANPNKQLLETIFAGLATGNSKAFVESLADDFCWTLTGTTKWSGTYSGKEAVMRELMRPLFVNFETRYTNTAQRFIAEGDWVVVECRGNVTTRRGQPYNNQYCWVCRVEGGKLKEVIEYMDTELVATALER